jgi:predicted Zn-dependent protease
LPYSRHHESEADSIGIQLMAKAGYDPSEAPLFWGRFGNAKSGSESPPEWASTHPSDDRRAAELSAKLPQALQLYQSAASRYGRGERLV